MASEDIRRRDDVPRADNGTTVDRIVLAASERFAERGFVGTTIIDIANAAGVSRALPAFHFGSKEGLLDAVIEKAREDITNVFEQTRGLRGLAALRSFLQARTAFFRERPQTARLLMVLGGEAITTRKTATFAEFQDRRAKLFARCIAEAIDDGSLRPDIDVDELTFLLVAATDGDIRMWGFDPERCRMDRTDIAILNLLRMLGPNPPAGATLD